MSDHDDETAVDETVAADEKPKQRRRRRAAATPKRSSRFERRAGKATETIRELVHLRRPDLDIEGQTFLEIVDRDASAWGAFLAQLGEWIVPFGQLIDLAFGQPLLVLLKLAPSVRAARRDLGERRRVRREQREEEALREQEEAGLQQEWEAQP